MRIGTTLATPVTPSERLADRLDVRLVAALLGLAALAFAIRFGGLALKGGLDSRLSLDEGTYFADAVAFVNGRLPYRDFSLLHPPGLLYVLTPFAQIGTLTTEMTGLVLARLVFMILGAVNTGLVGLIGARINRATGLAAAALYAVWILALNAERSTLLIAPQVTPMLVALLALTGRPASELSKRRVMVAGVAIGVTGAVQIWGAIPAIVILAWLILQTRSHAREAIRVAATFVLSGAATAALLLVPMLIAVGPRMVQMIIFAQATRVHGLQTNVISRLQYLEGLEVLPAGTASRVVVVVLLLAASALVLLAARRFPAIRLWVAIAASQVAVIMVLPIFLEHYRGWPAPLLALCLGAGVADALGRLPRQRRVAGYAAYAIVLVLFAAISLRSGGAQLPGLGPDMPELSAARCVIADEGYVAIRTHTLVRSLQNGCTILPNPRSFAQLFNATRAGPARGKTAEADYQQHTLDYFSGGDVLLLSQLGQDGLTDATMNALRTEFPSETKIGKILELRRR